MELLEIKLECKGIKLETTATSILNAKRKISKFCHNEVSLYGEMFVCCLIGNVEHCYSPFFSNWVK